VIPGHSLALLLDTSVQFIASTTQKAADCGLLEAGFFSTARPTRSPCCNGMSPERSHIRDEIITHTYIEEVVTLEGGVNKGCRARKTVGIGRVCVSEA